MNFIDNELGTDVLAFDNTDDVTQHAEQVRATRRIALRFPKWTDGRAYSQARLLRSRLRFEGEIVATGEVLVDMLPLLQRSGFDAVRLRGDQDRASAERALGFFAGPAAGYYQADLVSKLPNFSRQDS